MESNFSSTVSQPSYQNPVSQSAPSKALGTHSPATKSLGQGSAANSELAAWYEQAYAYYNAVMAGDPNTPKPDAQAWSAFLAQMQWAAGQLNLGTWDPGISQAPNGGVGVNQVQSNQFGGMTGTMDNWVYTDEKNSVGFTGDGTHDLWGNDVTINVAPTSADVTVETTTDTRFQPAETVVKITVTDPATGTQAVYFVHDYDPANGDKIKINTPNSDQQVVNNTGDPNITTGKFTGGAEGAGGKPDASIEGVVQEDGTILYEPEFAGGTIDFWANPGESQTHVVYSDANISVKPSDEVVVTQKPDGTIEVAVKHKDGSTDTYLVQKGYKVNVNANAEYIKFGTTPGTEGVPAEMSERVTLNGGVNDATASGGVDADAMIQGLMELSGKTEAQLLAGLKAQGFEFKDIAELKKAIQEKKFPPEKLANPTPGQPETKDSDLYRMLNFFAMIDPEIQEELNKSADKTDYKAINDRFVEYFQKLYPDAIVQNSGEGYAQGYITIVGVSEGELHWQSTPDYIGVTFSK
ncbi:hypothetical protein FBR05_09720 [Deltaproteobacteria bacterium PRO3]|nr:hypothetical protein [Deltaproteobacteria bacterium PRO3]